MQRTTPKGLLRLRRSASFVPRAQIFRGLFPRNASGARRARKLVLDAAQPWLSAEDLERLEYAAGEALANAVEHGNGSSLLVRCRRETDRCIVEIVDSGIGVPTSEALGTLPGAESPPGYGLFIMHKLADGIEILDGGTRVRLWIRRTSGISSLLDPASDGNG